jgi:hypothetical protein
MLSIGVDIEKRTSPGAFYNNSMPFQGKQLARYDCGMVSEEAGSAGTRTLSVCSTEEHNPCKILIAKEYDKSNSPWSS